MTEAVHPSNNTKNIQRRKPGEERRVEIANVAGELFAAHGFSVSTRAISEALGITQAALYKHFKSKEALIEEVFRQRYLDQRPSDFADTLSDRSRPLAARLTQAYTTFFDDITETSLKLFQRASYDGLEIAKRYRPHLDDRILWPLLDSLRVEATLPGIEQVEPRKLERELVMMLHSTIIFLAIRKFVYRIDFDGTEPDIIKLHVETWLNGALVSIRSIHA